MNKTAGVADH